MSRRQAVVAGGAGQTAVGSVHNDNGRYLTVTLDPTEGQLSMCVEVWPDVYIAQAEHDGNRVVAVIELVAGEWPEVVAEFDERATWRQVWAAMERLARRLGVCDGWEAYDVCLSEEVGKSVETVMALLGDP